MDTPTKRISRVWLFFWISLIAPLVLGTAIVLSMPLGSCHREAAQLHPGALDSFDSQTYDALLVAQAVLDQAKIEYAQGKLPLTSKPVINKTGDAYNIARDVWLEYRAIKQTTTQAGLNSITVKLTAALGQLNQLIEDVRQLIEKGGS